MTGRDGLKAFLYLLWAMNTLLTVRGIGRERGPITNVEAGLAVVVGAGLIMATMTWL